MPAFIKIDIEASRKRRCWTDATGRGASFEFTTIQRDVARACIERCVALGMTLFNAAIGESQKLGDWRSAEAIGRWLDELPHEVNSGDIYALRP